MKDLPAFIVFALGLLAFFPAHLVLAEPAVSEGFAHHRNGLRIRVPEGFSAVELDAGFNVREGEVLRSPREIDIIVSTTPPGITPARRRLVGHRLARFRVREVSIGSGGVLFELLASVRHGQSVLTVTAFQQVETGRPSFDAAWAILRSAELVEDTDRR